MSIIGKHRGWLLVYEIQFWTFLILSLLFAVFIVSDAVVFLSLFFLVFWGSSIWSLYGSTYVVRRAHIVWNWLAAAITLLVILRLPSDAANPSTRFAENTGSALWIALWVVWALYWHKSIRVRNSYPAPDQTQKTSQ